MARWDDGYVTDVVYTSNFHRETTPAWLSTTALLLGHRPPSLAAPFRYADLGCGNGLTALVVAATSPQAEVWGFDFNPAHIETARHLAARAGLGNVRFVETAFADLAALPPDGLPEFDFMVSHGVASWIAPEHRRHMQAVIRQRLRPGGLAYLSYNVTAGWSSMVPLRKLMRMLAEASPARADQAAVEALDMIDRLKAAGALFFANNPGLEPRLQDMRRQDPRYIAHEFLNQDWHPLSFADIASEMAECKCSYIGSATLTENIDAASVPPEMVQILAESRDPVLRETLRDLASCQGFRRDLYRRGITPIPAGEHRAMLDAITIASTGQTVPEPITFNTAIGTISGRPETYQPIQRRLAEGPVSVGELQASDAFAGRPPVEVLQAISLMIAGGYAHPLLPDGGSAAVRQSTRALNQAIAALNADGGELPQVALPLLGSAIPVDAVETLLLGELLAGKPAEPQGLVADLLSLLARAGRTLQRDGKPVTDAAEAGGLAADLVQQFLRQRLPLLRSLGVLDG
ncbi:MAG TPA: class I SAM-dependent methyltransferase [Acetobacteraceae bacterium]|nr:class I SAM-dependent methyltransferase [Acetobacteraceae bacterium]